MSPYSFTHANMSKKNTNITKKKTQKQADSTLKKVKSALAYILEGDSVRAATKQAGLAPSTFFLKMALDKELSEQYARAMQARAETMIEEIIEIADDARGDASEALGVYAVNTENIQRSKLRVDARKWAISKMHPKKYGELVKISGDNEAPVIIQIVRHSKTPDEN